MAGGLVNFTGSPVIIDGKPVQRAMRYERISLDEVKDAARAQGIESLAQVKVAILEPGGAFSFLKNEGQEDQEGPPARQE